MRRTRSNKSWKRQGRTATGAFKHLCGALIHDENAKCGRLLALVGKKPNVNKAVYNELLEKGIISEGTKKICATCLDNSKVSRKTVGNNKQASRFGDLTISSDDDNSTAAKEDYTNNKKTISYSTRLQKTGYSIPG